MNARQFFDLVAKMREAQKRSAVSLDIDDLRGAWMLEDEIDAEIARVNEVLARKAQSNQDISNCN